MKYEPDHFGKRGFERVFAKGRRPKAINLKELDMLAKELGKKNIDLAELGYEKVLGTGKLTTSLTVKAKLFSKKSIEKIEAAGGKIVKPEIKKERDN